jgi:RNA polymerase sigma-70 factor (ECF subfamily)
VAFEIPSGPELSARLDSVLDVLYLLFNEGYNASQGSDVIRHDLCDEAIRLTTLLTENPASETPKTHALLALFLFQAARFPARVDAAGEILLLQDQDRALWSREMIQEGMAHLERAAVGNEVSSFHLQAGIASCHCLAKSYDETDWARILSLYDLLEEASRSPVVALNRAIAVGKVRGAPSGLDALAEIKEEKALRRYYLFYAVQAEFCAELGRHDEARRNYEQALTFTELPAERNFLLRKLNRKAI